MVHYLRNIKRKIIGRAWSLDIDSFWEPPDSQVVAEALDFGRAVTAVSGCGVAEEGHTGVSLLTGALLLHPSPPYCAP